MPVYNGLPLLKASIRSILNQTYTKWECIIIDDGSTDGTSTYLDSIQDSRFRVCHCNVNYGRGVARQKALDICTGEYICMVDAEDVIHPNRITSQVEILENNPSYSLCTSAICSFGTRTDMLLVRGDNNSGEVVFSGDNHPIHAASMYRSSIAKRCRYNSKLRLGEDQDFLEKYLAINPIYYRISEVLYYYSELDSVSKSKIIKNYYIYIEKYLFQKNFRKAIIYLLKFVVAKIIFPFLTIDSILYRRGRKATRQEREDYKEYCLAIISDNKYTHL